MALVVFLRGCNVGGERTFRPTVLADELRKHDVVNIGAAGTFVVRKPVSQARLRADIRRRLPFDADVVICEGRDLLAAVSSNPFAGQPTRADIVQFVSAFGRRPRRRPPIPASLPENGPWVVRILASEGRFVFGLHRRQMKAIAQLGAIDRLFGERATTRSWSTIATIMKVLGSEGS
jgi:uncharacterized protein (DUF1697 family)